MMYQQSCKKFYFKDGSLAESIPGAPGKLLQTTSSFLNSLDVSW
jgi:hypothetical protein